MTLQAIKMRMPAAVVALACVPALAQNGHGDEPHDLKTTFSDEPAPMRMEDVPDRPAPLIELGDPAQLGRQTAAVAERDPDMRIFSHFKRKFVDDVHALPLAHRNQTHSVPSDCIELQPEQGSSA